MATIHVRALFDERFESFTEDVRRSLLLKNASVVVVVILLGVNAGWIAAAAWCVLAVASKLVLGFAATPAKLGAPRTVASGLACLASMVGSGLSWAVAATILWQTGEPGPRLVAMILLASLLILAQGASFKSVAAFCALAWPPATAFILLPLAMGGYSPVTTISIVACQALALSYLAFEVRTNARNAKALIEAQGRETAANRAKSTFLAMMSHELRTPMNGVLGMARAMTHTKLNHQQSSHLDMLLRSGEALMTILNDLLDISKIEAGKMELETIAFDLQELGRNACDLWSETASAKGVSLTFHVNAGTPQWVSGDPTRLRQVMLNLISNALKFTTEGQVRLSIEGVADGNTADIELAVSDSGAGMDEAQQAKLFNAFVQADASTTRKFGGTGLGLAICKQLIDLMGGEIDLTSKPGVGSTFRVRLRLPLADPVEVEEEAHDLSSLDGFRILVADDNAINQAVARAILESAGASVATVGDGFGALKSLQLEPFDIVLLDIHMPVMGGIEAVKQVRAGKAGRRDIPVIALTADAMPGVDERLIASGFDHVAPKPIDPSALIWAIADLAGRSSNRQREVEALASA